MYYCALLHECFFISFYVIPCPSLPGLTQVVSGLIFSIIYALLCIITCTFFISFHVIPCPSPPGLTQHVSGLIFSIMDYCALLRVRFFISFHVIPCPSPPGLSQSVRGLIFSIMNYCALLRLRFFYILPYNTMSFTSWTNTGCKWTDLFYHYVLLCIIT